MPTANLIKTMVTPSEIVQKIKERYMKEFGALDERGYFIAGFVSSVFNEDLKTDIFETVDINFSTT